MVEQSYRAGYRKMDVRSVQFQNIYRWHNIKKVYAFQLVSKYAGTYAVFFYGIMYRCIFWKRKYLAENIYLFILYIRYKF